jgi:hypothetical protein
MIDYECEAVGRMTIGMGNWNTRGEPFPAPLRPPQIQRNLAWARTRAAAVGSRRLPARSAAYLYWDVRVNLFWGRFRKSDSLCLLLFFSYLIAWQQFRHAKEGNMFLWNIYNYLPFWTARRHIPEDITHCSHHRTILRTKFFLFFWISC